ncbi:hypothetical protein G6F68_012107 [Rhizopus microsporus]|nr:hypothetical protein G6F68_012107 [Rhizopus microsporus]
MPSGRRSSEPSPRPIASGTAARIATMVVIMIGRKRTMLASRAASRGASPCSRCATSAKSIIMIAFFLTMPISRMMPMTAIRSNGRPVSSSASSAPTVADGRVERMPASATACWTATPGTPTPRPAGAAGRHRAAARARVHPIRPASRVAVRAAGQAAGRRGRAIAGSHDRAIPRAPGGRCRPAAVRPAPAAGPWPATVPHHGPAPRPAARVRRGRVKSAAAAAETARAVPPPDARSARRLLHQAAHGSARNAPRCRPAPRPHVASAGAAAAAPAGSGNCGQHDRRH